MNPMFVRKVLFPSLVVIFVLTGSLKAMSVIPDFQRIFSFIVLLGTLTLIGYQNLQPSPTPWQNQALFVISGIAFIVYMYGGMTIPGMKLKVGDNEVEFIQRAETVERDLRDVVFGLSELLVAAKSDIGKWSDSEEVEVRKTMEFRSRLATIMKTMRIGDGSISVILSKLN